MPPLTLTPPPWSSKLGAASAPPWTGRSAAPLLPRAPAEAPPQGQNHHRPRLLPSTPRHAREFLAGSPPSRHDPPLDLTADDPAPRIRPIQPSVSTRSTPSILCARYLDTQATPVAGHQSPAFSPSRRHASPWRAPCRAAQPRTTTPGPRLGLPLALRTAADSPALGPEPRTARTHAQRRAPPQRPAPPPLTPS